MIVTDIETLIKLFGKQIIIINDHNPKIYWILKIILIFYLILIIILLFRGIKFSQEYVHEF